MKSNKNILPPAEQGAKPLLSWKFLLVVVILGALTPFIAIGLVRLYANHLELSAPEVDLVEKPRGVGLSPVKLRFAVFDYFSGLSEVSVRLVQRNNSKEVLHKQYKAGERQDELVVPFAGERSGLEEGPVSVEIRARDRSVWGNVTDRSLVLSVDYHRPQIELLSKVLDFKPGETQVLFYRVRDKATATSGVKAGNTTFEGYPARGLDKDLDQKDLFVVMFTVPLKGLLPNAVSKVFAEDQVGNAASVPLDFKLKERSSSEVTLAISQEFLRENISALADNNFARVQSLAKEQGRDLTYLAPRDTDARLLEKFKLVNENLRALNEAELAGLLKGPRFERYWQDFFLPQSGKLDQRFGNNAVFRYNGQAIGNWKVTGQRFSMSKASPPVLAVNNGIVIFSDNLGVFGRLVGIDHGLGVVSIYANLESVNVRKGDTVSRGDAIGQAGSSGFAASPQIYVELRVQGEPVDAEEWIDPGRYHYLFAARIEELKRQLGIPIARRLE